VPLSGQARDRPAHGKFLIVGMRTEDGDVHR
jgi:hypothetical protein